MSHLVKRSQGRGAARPARANPGQPRGTHADIQLLPVEEQEGGAHFHGSLPLVLLRGLDPGAQVLRTEQADAVPAGWSPSP